MAPPRINPTPGTGRGPCADNGEQQTDDYASMGRTIPQCFQANMPESRKPTSEPPTVMADPHSIGTHPTGPGPFFKDIDESTGTYQSGRLPITPRTIVEVELDEGIAEFEKYLGILQRGLSLVFSARFLDGRLGLVSCPPYPVSATRLPEARQLSLQIKLAFAKMKISGEEWTGLKRRYGVDRESYFQLDCE
ncbi:uncharacterized protein BDV17DRAFT_288459 [Aspergillus undulatus]|uniref:uncharacterized protein n=1 Tax=Aspergillus undulatus TaxID=1810928 RepID=UPI003CCCA5E9